MVLQKEGSHARCHPKLTAKNYRLGCVDLIKSVPDEAVCLVVGGSPSPSPAPQHYTTTRLVVDHKVDIAPHDAGWSKTEKGKQAGCRKHSPQCAACPKTCLIFTLRSHLLGKLYFGELIWLLYNCSTLVQAKPSNMNI